MISSIFPGTTKVYECENKPSSHEWTGPPRLADTHFEGRSICGLTMLIVRWDVGRLVSPFLSFFYTVHRFLLRNRSIAGSTLSDPNPLNKWNFASRIEPYASRYFTHPPYRLHRWELCTLAVDSRYQRRGIGQELVAWGLERAKTDGLPAVVIAAKDTEPFYLRCGFAHLVGYVSTAEIENDDHCIRVKRIDVTNPLKARGIGGGAVLWTELREEQE